MKKPVVGACWVAAFVVGWAAGRHPVSETSRADVMPREGRSGVRESRSWSPAERLGRLRTLAGLSHPRLEERIEIGRHLAGLPLEEVKRLSRAALVEPWKRADEVAEAEWVDSVLRPLAIEEWCRRDPFGLLESGHEWNDVEIALALRAAALADPARAKDHEAGKVGRHGYRERTGLFQGLAEAASDLAFAAARELTDEHFDSMDMGEVAECFADPLRKLEWADLVFERLGVGKQPDLYPIFRMVAEDDVDLLERAGHLQVVREYENSISRTVNEQRWKNAGLGNPMPASGEDGDDSSWGIRGRRIERWFASDPAAAVAWLDALPDEAKRKSHIGDLTHSAVMTDFQSLDRALEAFTSPGDREVIMRRAIYLLSDFNTSTSAGLRAFVGKYPEARQFVKRPRMLDP